MEMRTLTITDIETEDMLFDVAEVVHAAMRYKSTIRLQAGGVRVNAKSFMGLTVLSRAQGRELTVLTEGADELEAVNALCRVLWHSINRRDAMA